MITKDQPLSLDRHDLIAGLNDLGQAAADAGKIIDLCIYGGSCLILVSDFRVASQDVDAVAVQDQAFVDAIAKQIAIRRSWPMDWLNDGVRTWLSPSVETPGDLVPVGTYPSEERPGLRTYVPTAEYMLAMKLMAMRIGGEDEEKDLTDIENLINVTGVLSKKDLIDLAAKFYPEAKVSGKLHLSASALLDRAKKRTDTGDDPPKYLE